MHAVIGNLPRHYQRLNLTPDVVQPWEDGLRTDPAQGTFEWWYCDAHLDDGSTLTIEFHTKPPFVSPRAPLTPFVLLTLTRPDGSRTDRQYTGEPPEFTASREKCDVGIGPHTFRSGPDGYTIHVEIEDTVVDLTLTPQVPPVPGRRPGTPRDFAPDPDGLDTRWCGDIAYVATDEGWLYLATVIDIASRRVVGWSTADHLRTELVADALTAACRERRPARPVIFHSDRGCQYTSRQFATLAAEFGVRLSVGRTGQCWDNALAESFFATIKRELLDTSSWHSRAAARTAIFDFIEGWYNLHRLHSSLGYRSPAEYETALAA
ncbi:IS3 family transposase [Streptomyces sp. NPDC051098]|uniref:IS3 family transposase n=1 Tax=Streptomyces sp. NPDC051098 TaxID=3155411 RepID=UPI00342C48AF